MRKESCHRKIKQEPNARMSTLNYFGAMCNNGVSTMYRLDAELRELRDLVSRGALSCRRTERSEGATKGLTKSRSFPRRRV